MSDRTRGFARIALLGVATAIGTWILGWWAVPLLGAAWGVMRRGQPRFWTAAFAGVVGWWLLMAWDAIVGPVGRMAALLGGIFGIGAWGMVVLMYLFPFLLAGCAAQVAGFTLGRPKD